jgi:hypothetical protein
VGATKDLRIGFHSVPHDAATAMAASRGESVDRALKRVEPVRLAVAPDLERLVVVVAAHLANRHIRLLKLAFGWSVHPQLLMTLNLVIATLGQAVAA